MIKRKEENENDNNTNNNSDSGDYLNYLKINGLNKLEEVNSYDHIQQLITFSNTLTLENENNVGRDMNKFFNLILDENKEVETLKVNLAISDRLKKEKNIKPILDKILNHKESSNIVLTNDLCDIISKILSVIYQKIKNKNKFKNFDELVEKMNTYNFGEGDILKNYLIEEDKNE